MRRIEIIKAGLSSTIQDKGRWGYQDKGISVSGAMDQLAFKMANMLACNEENTPCIEMTMLGDTIKFHDDCIIAITGADLQFKINGKPIQLNKTLYVCSGDILTSSFALKGMRAYLSIRGGLKIPNVLASTSTFQRCKLGGHQGRKLKSGDIIEVNCICDLINYAVVPEHLLDELYSSNKIRFTFGNEKNRFTDNGITTFLTSTYMLTNESDRMGFRLSGQAVEHTDGSDIISGGINFGSIQIPGNGQPIIMMADRQPTGGYTKIGQVIQLDLPKLAQKKPQDSIEFDAISIEDAINLWRSINNGLDQWYGAQDFDPRPIPDGLSMKHCIYEKIYDVEVRKRHAL